MRDPPGLNGAIDTADGATQLARKMGIAQPLVSNGNRVPSQGVLAVEAVTGASRKQVRPDLYSEPAVKDDALDPVDAARAQEYALLAALLSSPPSNELLGEIAQLRGDATPLGRAHAALAEAASEATVEVEREYFDLFVGLGRGELLPYGSYYLTGFLNERPLSRLRDDLAALGIERVENNFEPEDHAATLCEIMAGLAGRRFPASAEMQRRFFEKHVVPWMGRLFADMETAASAKFYRSVGSLGRLFLKIETEAFRFAN
ncbi:MAG TPA: molecular chaperone TorD family protein [Bradyrhizobium sp.]|nr:molecular chaperone TorD family protein [Bradyrhizobium sp.]